MPKPAIVALPLAALLMLGAADNAKADPGTAIGVGAYLVGDYIVGRKCRMGVWPFNIVVKVAYGLHGRRVCRYYRRRY